MKKMQKAHRDTCVVRSQTRFEKPLKRYSRTFQKRITFNIKKKAGRRRPGSPQVSRLNDNWAGKLSCVKRRVWPSVPATLSSRVHARLKYASADEGSVRMADRAIIISILYVFTGNIKRYDILDKCQTFLRSCKIELSNYEYRFTVIAFDKAGLDKYANF
ncbi:hypothetical protein PUN28_004773 [Cardiocondyla obscurior]|uniref:Uncharacterized protein n=1 Tax=Cardiocondyla obscurior TaxID=286306 RepID=A0AAW2GD20_9HYME